MPSPNTSSAAVRSTLRRILTNCFMHSWDSPTRLGESSVIFENGWRGPVLTTRNSTSPNFNCSRTSKPVPKALDERIATRPERLSMKMKTQSGTMPTPTTISEALYDTVIRHEFIRMGEFAEMLTHSATVNHGGRLWKEGERVWANPCYYGRSIGSALVGKTPAAVDVTCDTVSTEMTFREIEPVDNIPALHVMAAVDDGDELVVVVVNRASREETTELTIDVGGVGAAPERNLTSLSGKSM